MSETQNTDPNPLLNAPCQDERLVVKASELQEGDYVDMIESDAVDPFPFVYHDELAEYEMGHVDEIRWEGDNCVVVSFDNLTAVAVSPEQQFVIADRPTVILPYRP